MRVQDYRDLISNVSDAVASLRSAATPQEQEAEAYRVIRINAELKSAGCPRANASEVAKAACVHEIARQLADDVLSRLHDNQTVECGSTDFH